MSSPHPAVPGTNQAAIGHATHSNNNYVSLCRLGQETVQEVVTKTMELFQLLKNMQLPTDATVQSMLEKKNKVEDHSKLILTKIKTLHVIYDRLIDYCATLDNQDKASPSLQAVQEEHQETVEQVRLKNAQLKEIIDHLRTVIWEINTMIAMRKTVIT